MPCRRARPSPPPPPRVTLPLHFVSTLPTSARPSPPPRRPPLPSTEVRKPAHTDVLLRTPSPRAPFRRHRHHPVRLPLWRPTDDPRKNPPELPHNPPPHRHHLSSEPPYAMSLGAAYAHLSSHPFIRRASPRPPPSPVASTHRPPRITPPCPATHQLPGAEHRHSSPPPHRPTTDQNPYTPVGAARQSTSRHFAEPCHKPPPPPPFGSGAAPTSYRHNPTTWHTTTPPRPPDTFHRPSTPPFATSGRTPPEYRLAYHHRERPNPLLHTRDHPPFRTPTPTPPTRPTPSTALTHHYAFAALRIPPRLPLSPPSLAYCPTNL